MANGYLITGRLRIKEGHEMADIDNLISQVDEISPEVLYDDIRVVRHDDGHLVLEIDAPDTEPEDWTLVFEHFAPFVQERQYAVKTNKYDDEGGIAMNAHVLFIDETFVEVSPLIVVAESTDPVELLAALAASLGKPVEEVAASLTPAVLGGAGLSNDQIAEVTGQGFDFEVSGVMYDLYTDGEFAGQIHQDDGRWIGHASGESPFDVGTFDQALARIAEATPPAAGVTSRPGDDTKRTLK